jgi:hypothetical protein
MSVTVYPDAFPKPTVQGYGIEVDMGLIRTEFDTGNHRQRRTYKTMPHQFALNFAMSVTQLYAWQNWVNQNAYTWFSLDMMSFLTGNVPGHCSQHLVRFISNLSITPMTQTHVQVSVAAEMTDPLGNVIITSDGDWIIGGDPESPSADWVIGGEPDAASQDFTNPGTPQYPSSIA